MHEHYLAQLPPDLRAPTPPARTSLWWRHGDTDVHIEAVGEPGARVRVIVVHGAGGHAAALWPYAALLADRYGFHVLVPDLPGYGRTRVPRRGAVRYADWVGTVCALVREQRHAHEGPLVLVGASMGGLLAYDVATRTGAVDKVVATCLLDPRDPDSRRHMARNPWLGAVARPVLRAVAGPLGGVSVPLRLLTNMRAIANTPELVSLIVHDERGGGTSMPLGFLRGFLDSAPAVEPESATAPAFVLAHPAEDRWTPAELSLRFFDRIAAPKTFVVLDGAGHYPVESPGVRQLVAAIAHGLA